MAKRNDSADGATIIKKYANRRLYNTASSSYITLEDLARMTREGVDFRVLDAKSGEDLTHTILTQIIMEEESSGGEQMLPISFLRQLIGMYGNSMQSMMPAYLDAMMSNFRDNQAKVAEALHARAGSNPFAKMAETNMAMMRAAADALMPRKPEATNEAEPAPPRADELDELRAQMAAMQKKLDELGK
ncbi:polyhydroxyalkanoate synthesis repressor PhaR [Parafrankia sp. BMG5.11]|uniref:polyhydroxyalkanoate synthesis repressor PhaR n=1 Tax=Parafrankia sp. BMG5.11 TaxID=222540 RepID=UPI0010399A0D|nr:polyhydroxyalkanoate synthesis repressor PhaR [Parafrankia sp. BMG5.11]TCJ37351.1 polyhydroxyalkanoate synthesis repressor PhaR [Parafrankia sp. BMG5.11]